MSTQRKHQALNVAGQRAYCGVKQKQRTFCCGGVHVPAGELYADINAACDRILSRGMRSVVVVRRISA